MSVFAIAKDFRFTDYWLVLKLMKQYSSYKNEDSGSNEDGSGSACSLDMRSIGSERAYVHNKNINLVKNQPNIPKQSKLFRIKAEVRSVNKAGS